MKPWLLARSRLLLLSLAVLAAECRPASACPNCKEAVAAQPGATSRLQDGYSYSILLMVGMPLLLTGAGGWMIARSVRNGSFPEL